MVKTKTSIICNTSDQRAKPSDILDSRALILDIWGTYGHVAFNIILGSFGAPEILLKYDFQNAASSTLRSDFFTAKDFACAPFDNPHKSYFLVFWNLNFKKLKNFVI